MFLTLRRTVLHIILKKIYKECKRCEDKIKRILLKDSRYGSITNDTAIGHKSTNRNQFSLTEMQCQNREEKSSISYITRSNPTLPNVNSLAFTTGPRNGNVHFESSGPPS